jgi:hypothetical protein
MYLSDAILAMEMNLRSTCMMLEAVRNNQVEKAVDLDWLPMQDHLAQCVTTRTIDESSTAEDCLKYLEHLYKGLTEAMEKGIILEAIAVMCTSSHDLMITLPCANGIIPREEGALGIREGSTRDIAVISRVRKPVCFKVMELSLGEDGNVTAVLSRREAQEECRRNYISTLRSGDVIDCRVTHLEQFGCFVDIGCGIVSLIPIDSISVSRIF